MKRKHLCFLCDTEFAQVMLALDMLLFLVLGMVTYFPSPTISQ